MSKTTASRCVIGRAATYGIHTNDNVVRWMGDETTKKDTSTNSPPKEEGEDVIKIVGAEEIFTDEDLNDSIQHPLDSLKGSKEEYTVEVKIDMPDMGDGDDNTIETWYKQPGDIIKFNDVLCDISTPDFTFGMVIEDEEDAIMGEILVQAGETADDDAPICITYHRQEPTEDGNE